MLRVKKLIPIVVLIILFVVFFTDNILIYKLTKPVLEGKIIAITDEYIDIGYNNENDSCDVKWNEETVFFDGRNYKKISFEELKVGDCVEVIIRSYRPHTLECGSYVDGISIIECE
ncbi:MAG: hypothetical protein KAH05_03050 [Clostridiales bacterium]|nr:hypothetical protein [Clostridiales bacterium]